ncbi:DUF3077 domain-containing protein [Pseudomonas chlororaphis]|uniref:DUF3077 domain-containing protein n=1 Tax=Pseudomonas chlororaphis TaxID=587753 RepID=UPI000F56DD7D|nr:DUF3077 domain-containing protein [Pseudomonas chlororaphis]AZE08161.1 hypothetical protein C4K11_6044 [Pseudomonas chlororaphis subsp. aureofaciens]AZE14343.1 hypothetical protein C4K10_6108 [Pseudomonas chlororaphis subsp. aureofaciens]MBP5066169.1 DUF3077 domain-containing protein [Pseudomonas chlororaphis]QTT97368.1 DUF3077 domain-containing protein [Pseudomonas chlororaphis]
MTTSIKTIGIVTFADCGEKEQSLFRVNPDIPVREALEHASNLFYYAKKLMLDAAMEEQGERYAWPAYYLCEMGKAVVDDLSTAMLSDPATVQERA